MSKSFNPAGEANPKTAGNPLPRRVAGRRKRTRGGAVLELALFSPWFFFLAIGALDWGFYGYALISMQAATRSAILYTATSSATSADSTTACSIVLGEMRSLPNVGTGTTTCAANPVTVTATSITGPDGAAASQVSVRYQSVSLIPIPGVLAKQFTITRIAKMRIRG